VRRELSTQSSIVVGGVARATNVPASTGTGLNKGPPTTKFDLALQGSRRLRVATKDFQDRVTMALEHMHDRLGRKEAHMLWMLGVGSQPSAQLKIQSECIYR
jgi:hypothetical protein